MTEADWLTCRNPWVMLPELGSHASDRKLRLFVCACCRRHAERASLAGLEDVLTLAEGRMDGTAAEWELERVPDAIEALAAESLIVAEAAGYAVLPEPLATGLAAIAVDLLIDVGAETGADFDEAEERAQQCRLLREIFGNPFRPSAVHPAWLNGTVVGLGEAIYDTGDFTRLPILADALEEAGCTSADILAHCREPGEHVKGCWVVDLVLGKE